MNVLVVIAAITTLLSPIDGARSQCIGADSNDDRSGWTLGPSGFLTADWTQKACSAAGLWIDPNKKSNAKCCHVVDSRFRDFCCACEGYLAGNFPKYQPSSSATW
ncbi:hypothetical protein PHMEG_00034067 [Phytophthora megakarya]|uniref:Secreted protein n=1 Tax=Phytophthora megakarya TaxID=4795 RepID=A0A225UUE3_9STRA|nr:hypothetical protein PHMEG_00034067 [Phytophthora megakarya]